MQTYRSLFILILIVPVFCFGQVKNIGTPVIRNYQKSVYKAGTQNWDIAQDKNGFMYFANNGGLLKFDGFNWEIVEDVTRGVVRSVLVDSQDRIFVGLQFDFGILQKDNTGRLKYKSLLNLVPTDKRVFSDIWKIHEINKNIVFQSFERMFIYNGSEIKVIDPENQFHFSFNINNRLLVQDKGVGLFEVFNDKLDKVPWAGALQEMEIWSILEINENSLIIGTASNGFYYYSNGKLSLWESEISNFIKTNKLFSATSISGNFYAIGTVLGGLAIADEDGKIIQHISREKGLQNNTVLSVFTDWHKNLWLGLDNGIGYIEVNSPLSYISDQGDIGTGYCCEIFDNKLYVGTNQGLYVRPFKSYQINNERFELVKNTEGQVWSLTIHDGQLVCGHNIGTFIVKNNIATKILDEPGGWDYIQLEKHPDFVLGGHYKGLVVLKKEISGLKFHHKVKGFNESSRYLFEDDNGVIWMSHGGKGIFSLVLNEKADSVTSVKLYGTKNGLPSNTENILFKLKGRLYVSTVNGVFEYNSFNDSFIVADDVNKLFGFKERIKTVETDNFGNIWFISKNESGVLRPNNDLSYTKITGPFALLNDNYVNEFEFIYPYQNNHVIIGIDKGFAHYSANFQQTNYSEFKSFITKVELNYLDTVIYPVDVLKDEHKFPFRGNSFRFQFTSPFYENTDGLRFSYFLENYSDKWSDWSTDNYKDFTNLYEGKYTFKVKALNFNGVESEISTFSFAVTPPWQRSQVAIYIYLVLTILAIYFLVKFILHRIELSKLKEKQKHEEKLKKQEEVFQHQAIIAEKEIIKLRNDKLRAEKTHRDKELANQTMVVIQKNKLLRKLNEELKRILSSTKDSELISKLVLIKQRIKRELDDKHQNMLFETYFEDVHANFFKSLKEKYPQLTVNDLRLCAYIKMNITSKEIASLLNISARGVEINRYRLRKKMDLPREINLTTFLSNV